MAQPVRVRVICRAAVVRLPEARPGGSHSRRAPEVTPTPAATRVPVERLQSVMPYARGALFISLRTFCARFKTISGFWVTRTDDKPSRPGGGGRRGVKLPRITPVCFGQSPERPYTALRRTRTTPRMHAPDRNSPGMPVSSVSALPPRTDRLPSSARPESATAMPGGTAIVTSPSTEITLIFRRSPRTSASVRSIRARPAKAMTSVLGDAGQPPSRLELPSSATTLARGRLARSAGCGRVAPGCRRAPAAGNAMSLAVGAGASV